jgi:TonB family protein
MKTLLISLLAVTVTGAFAQSATSSSARFDEFQSSRIIQTVEPVFPETLIPLYRNGGQVNILISIDAKGHLADWLVTRYTDRLFADAAIDALKRWEFEPARVMGEAVSVCIDLHFGFEVKGVVISTTISDTVTAMFNAVARDAYYPCTLRELDRIPVPLNTVAPAYPQQAAERGATGEVVVDFYIDETGAVRMPYVTGRPHVLLANLAVDAVRQWRFEPPTRNGNPVLVHARQLFRFTPTAAKTG